MSCPPGLHTQQHSRQCHVQKVDYAFDLIELHQADPERYPHILQSTAQGRYDILFAFPGDSLVLNADGTVTVPDCVDSSGSDFLAALDDWWQQERTVVPDEADLPFTGGWFVYLGYELAGQIEPCLQLPPSNGDLPVAIATRFRSAVIRDNEQQQSYIVGEFGQSASVESIREDLASLYGSSATNMATVATVSEDKPQDYLDAIGRIQSYIREGDVFQVNLSRHWEITLEHSVAAAALFNNLARHNPSPFAGMATWKDVSIISSSPERLVCVHDGMIETRPIAGTRPRSN